MLERFGGRFEAWEPLGQGAEGRLYRVRDRWTGRLCALKVASDPAGASALAHEFALLSRYRHPALIESLDLVREGADTAHLMEYVPAMDPRTLREAGGEAAVHAALLQSIRGLEYLHGHGIVHGDVSPGNILVWKDGPRWRATVADLGLALPAAEASCAGVRGTAGYMAPEVARGQGAVPASDWYALALTAATWMDGEGHWEGLSSTQALRRQAEAVAAPLPRRRVGLDLGRLLSQLGAADPAARGGWDWELLRENADLWGPPALVPGVFGLEESLAGWREWVEGLPPGRAGAVVLRGRVGSGRRTAGEALIRALVGQGYTALWSLSVGALREWLEAPGDPDPVALAREVVRRFEGKDVALLWPERAGDLESRLLRAFLTSREEEGSVLRTVAVKPAPLHREDADAAWLVGSVRSLEAERAGPSLEGLHAIRGDMLPLAEGYRGDEVPIEAGTSPLSLVLFKRARVTGADVSAAGSVEDAVEEDVRAAWEKAPVPVRQTLAVLARSDDGWALDSLGRCLGWDEGAVTALGEDLSRLRLTSRTFTEAGPVEQIADWLVRERVAARADEAFTPELARSLGTALEVAPYLHPGDLGVLGALTEHGVFPRGYAEEALEGALRAGRYDAVLACWHALMAVGSLHVETERFVWEAALRAAHKIGRFPDEVEALQALVPVTEEVGELVRLRKMLCEALWGKGDWEGSISACEALAEMNNAPVPDRVWAEVRCGEYLWQAGKMESAQLKYELIKAKALEHRELALRLLVGRARFALQQDSPIVAETILEEALARLGVETCNADALFLHTRVGVLVKTGNQRLAEPLAVAAAGLAEQNGAWTDYVLTAGRAGNLLFEVGKTDQAQHLMKRVISVATTLGAERQVEMANIGLGFLEVVLGQFGSALKKVETYSRSAPPASTYAARLGAFLGSRAGFKDLLCACASQLRRSEDPLLVSLADQYEGMFLMGLERCDEAARFLAPVAVRHRELGLSDSAAMVECFLAYCEAKSGHHDEARERYEEARKFFADGKYPLLRPISRIIGLELGYKDNPEELLKELADENRRPELVLWGSQLLRAARDKAQFRRVILGAFKQTVESIDSPSLRKDFLSVPAHQRTLQQLQAGA